MLKALYQQHRQGFRDYDNILTRNTVLVQGLCIAPVVVAATTLKNACLLGLAFAVITFVSVVLLSFLPKKTPFTLRAIAAVLLACGVFIPTALWVRDLFPGNIQQVGIFLPLLVTNSVLVGKTEESLLHLKKAKMLLKLITYILGFELVILFTGLVRELLAFNTVWGNPVTLPFTFSVMALPFGGFVLLGFLAAAVRRYREQLNKPGSGEEE